MTNQCPGSGRNADFEDRCGACNRKVRATLDGRALAHPAPPSSAEVEVPRG